MAMAGHCHPLSGSSLMDAMTGHCHFVGEYFESDTENFGLAYESRDKTKQLWSKVGKRWDDESDHENNGELVGDQGGEDVGCRG